MFYIVHTEDIIYRKPGTENLALITCKVTLDYNTY
jgi:hypothetical protein